MGSASRILVTGDYGFGYGPYLPTDNENPATETPPTRVAVSIGGAGIALRVLQSVVVQVVAAANELSVKGKDRTCIGNIPAVAALAESEVVARKPLNNSAGSSPGGTT